MILIDRRTGSKELAAVIAAPFTVTTLEYGDASFTGNGPTPGLPVFIGIERKTIMDLLSSITSGRLSGHQLIGLLNSYNYTYLLVEGMWRPSPTGILQRWSGKWRDVSLGQRRFMYREVANYLNSLTILCGVHVWRTETLSQSGHWITALYGWWQKEWEGHRAHIQHSAAPPPPSAYLRKPSITHRVAKEFEGVGWDKGKALASHFKSVHSLVNATEAKLRLVPGIGKKLARTITEEVHKR